MSSSTKEGIGDTVDETDVVIMHEDEYLPLCAVNNYGDNLLHLSATNGCNSVIEEIFKKKAYNDIDPKNDCGWTPLMQAIRNGNVETVKTLLANGCSPEESKSGDVSAIGLAAAMGLPMFDIVYNACPSALESSKHDSIGPLCVAAMKRDKELFFRLIELGVKVSDANEYTHLIMRQSGIPEIVELADANPDVEDPLNDSLDQFDFTDEDIEAPQMSSTLDNIESSLSDALLNETKSAPGDSDIPSIQIIPPCEEKNIFTRRNSQSLRSKTPTSIDELPSPRSISPRLAYTRKQIFPKSPNVCFVKKKESQDDSGCPAEDGVDNDKHKLQKYKKNRPPDLEISEDNSSGPEYFSEDHRRYPSVLCSNKTPIEPPYSTPPIGMILDEDQTKITVLLKRFGLAHFIYTFLEQEVDLDLFLTLNDQDLREIGIERKSDRMIILSVIGECNRYKV